MDFVSRTQDSLIFTRDFSEHGQILGIEFSPFVLSQDLILIAFEAKILLAHLKLDNAIDLEVLAEFKHVTRCTALTFSPETSVSILPNSVVFAAAGSDYKLRVFKTDLRGNDSCKVLSGHTSYVNDAKFDPDNTFIVSVSDDNSAKLWDAEDLTCVATLQLTSPGMAVCWHKEDNSKLLVAEKIGLIRFYNVETQSPILSLDYGKPLSGAHWAPSDSQLIATLQLGELLTWDLSKPCVPLSSVLLFTESGSSIRFSPLGELIAAVSNMEGVLKVVQVSNNNLKMSVPVTLPSNVVWHCRAPVVCVGDYKKLLLWKVTAR